MSKNVEIKAKISDLNSFLQLASSIADRPAEILEQVDTYFKVENGRLKLRQIQVFIIVSSYYCKVTELKY